MALVSPRDELPPQQQQALLRRAAPQLQAQQQPVQQASQQWRQQWEHRRQLILGCEAESGRCSAAQPLPPPIAAAAPATALTDNDFGPSSANSMTAAGAAAVAAAPAMMASSGPLDAVGPQITRNASAQSGLLQRPRVPHLPLQQQQQQLLLPQTPQPPPSQVQIRQAFVQTPSASSTWLSSAPAACPTGQPPAVQQTTAASTTMVATAVALADEVAQLRREVEQLRSQRMEAVDFDRQALQKLVSVVEQEGGLRVRLYETEREERKRVTSELRAELQDLRRAMDRDCTTRPPSPTPTQLLTSSPAGSSRHLEPPLAVGPPPGAAPSSTCEFRTEDGQSARCSPGVSPWMQGSIRELAGLREHIESELRSPLKDLQRDCMAAYNSCREDILALREQVAPLQEQVRVLLATASNHCQQLQRVEETLGLTNPTTLAFTALPRQAPEAAATTASPAALSAEAGAPTWASVKKAAHVHEVTPEGSAETVPRVAPMPVASQLNDAAGPAGSQPTSVTGMAAAGLATERSQAPERAQGPWTERASRPGVRAAKQTRQEAAHCRSASLRGAAARAH